MSSFIIFFNWLNSLKENELQFLISLPQPIATLIGAAATLIAASVAVFIAFKQLKKQFEHKVIYEGWIDFQEKLFTFSSALSEYNAKVLWLPYVLSSQNNPLVNGGNNKKYRQDKANELNDTYATLQKAYIEFLRSFETHEIVFLSLLKMKSKFQSEYRQKLDVEADLAFEEKIFPEMFGSTNTYTQSEVSDAIKEYANNITEITIYLDDFRKELQNVTVGKILGKRMKRRRPNPGLKVLTANGVMVQRESKKLLVKNFYKRFKKLVKDKISLHFNE